VSVPIHVPESSPKWKDLRPGSNIQANRDIRDGITIESCRLYSKCIFYRPVYAETTSSQNSFQINKGDIFTVVSLIEQTMGTHTPAVLILKNESNMRLEIKASRLSDEPSGPFSREHLDRIGFNILPH